MKRTDEQLTQRVHRQARDCAVLVKGERNPHARALARPHVKKALDESLDLGARILSLEMVSNILMAAALAR